MDMPGSGNGRARRVLITDIDQTLFPHSAFAMPEKNDGRGNECLMDDTCQKRKDMELLESLAPLAERVEIAGLAGKGIDPEYWMAFAYHMLGLHSLTQPVRHMLSKFGLGDVYPGVQEFLRGVELDGLYGVTTSPYYMAKPAVEKLSQEVSAREYHIVANNHVHPVRKIAGKLAGRPSSGGYSVTKQTKPAVILSIILSELKTANELVVYVMGNKPADIGVVDLLSKQWFFRLYLGIDVEYRGLSEVDGLMGHEYSIRYDSGNGTVEKTLKVVPVVVNPNPKYMSSVEKDDAGLVKIYGGIPYSAEMSHLPQWAYRGGMASRIAGISPVYYAMAILSGLKAQWKRPYH